MDYINQDKITNITDIISTLINEKETIVGFPIHEYWIDIGKRIDFEKADQEFKSNF